MSGLDLHIFDEALQVPIVDSTAMRQDCLAVRARPGCLGWPSKR